MKRAGQDQVIGKGSTRDEHPRRCDQKRQERTLFIAIKPRRHKAPQLEGNDRKRHRKARPDRDLDGHEEAFLQLDQHKLALLAIVGHGRAHRGRQDVKDRRPQQVSDQTGHTQCCNRNQDAVAQLFQVFDQRGGAVFDIVRVAHASSAFLVLRGARGLGATGSVPGSPATFFARGFGAGWAAASAAGDAPS